MVRITEMIRDDHHHFKESHQSKRMKFAFKTELGLRMNEEKALYHCNHCRKDITEKVRFKCAICPDFDLCVECFTVGVKLHPHKKNHPYRVIAQDNSFISLLCPDWSSKEKGLLLEGLEMFGLNDWAKVADHVKTKSESVCIHHYYTYYINTPCFPLPNGEEPVRVKVEKEDSLIPGINSLDEIGTATISMSLSIDETGKTTTSTSLSINKTAKATTTTSHKTSKPTTRTSISIDKTELATDAIAESAEAVVEGVAESAVALAAEDHKKVGGKTIS